MSFSTLLAATGCLAVAFVASPRAQAVPCGDTDCGKGFTCMTETEPTLEPEPAKVACPVNTACPVTDPAPAVDAGASTISWCAAATCTTDDDCGVGMICHSSTEDCASSGVACAAGAKCPTTPSTPCVPKTISLCAYKWQLACNADADCGDGFVCQPSAGACAESGSGGAPTPATASNSSAAASAPNMPIDGGSAKTAPDPSCMTASFPGSCQPKIIACTADAECPATWTCAEQSVGGGVASPGTTGSVSSSGAPAGTIAPGEPDPTSSAPTTTMKLCTPPGGAVVDPPRAAASDGGAAPVVAGDMSAKGDNDGTTTTTSDKPAGSSSPTGSAAGSAPSAGCAVGGGGGTSTFGLAALGLLGLALARRRR